jgi:hypothetical protein
MAGRDEFIISARRITLIYDAGAGKRRIVIILSADYFGLNALIRMRLPLSCLTRREGYDYVYCKISASHDAAAWRWRRALMRRCIENRFAFTAAYDFSPY